MKMLHLFVNALLLSAMAMAYNVDQAGVQDDSIEAENFDTKSLTINIEDGEEKLLSIGNGDNPVLLCYPGPKFNIWRTWEDVTFEVSGTPFLPKIFGASEDDVHGLLDSLIKHYVLKDTESITDIVTKIERRAVRRTQYYPAFFDLLTECPPIWNQSATTCTKVFSPFGRSCVAVSVPRNFFHDKKAEVKVKLTVAYQSSLPFIMFIGFLLMYSARFFSKSKILWYSSGISVSVLLGIVILLIFLCRRLRWDPSPRHSLQLA